MALLAVLPGTAGAVDRWRLLMEDWEIGHVSVGARLEQFARVEFDASGWETLYHGA